MKMSNIFYNFSPKKVIYDGDENGFYDFECEVKLPKSEDKVLFINALAKPLWKINNELAHEIVKNIKSIKVNISNFDPLPTYKHDNLDVYLQAIQLDKECVALIVAAGESQPARFKIKLLGAFRSI